MEGFVYKLAFMPNFCLFRVWTTIHSMLPAEKGAILYCTVQSTVLALSSADTYSLPSGNRQRPDFQIKTLVVLSQSLVDVFLSRLGLPSSVSGLGSQSMSQHFVTSEAYKCRERQYDTCHNIAIDLLHPSIRQRGPV